MDIQVLEEIKNKRGEIKRKVSRVTNKTAKKALKFETINSLYETLLKKYKPEQITIIAKPVTGTFVTLKSQGYTGDSLKYTDDKYFSSQPKEVHDRLTGKYYSVDIIIDI